MTPGLAALWTGLDGWQVAAMLARLAVYASCLLASGGVFFLLLFRAQLLAAEQQLIRRAVALAAWAALVSSVVRLGVVNGMLSGEASGMFDPAMARMLLATREGPALLLRAVGLGLVLVLGAMDLVGLTRGSARWRGWPLAVPLLGAVLATLSFGLVGHADELYPQAFSIAHALIALHLLAIAFWLGALWPLYRLLGHPGAADTRTAALVARFGQIATAVVALLVAAGGLLLWLLLGSFGALWQTAYGLLMLAKLAAVASLLALAALNKLRFTPRLLRGDLTAPPALRRAIAAEMLAAGLILLATAALTTLAGPPALG